MGWGIAKCGFTELASECELPKFQIPKCQLPKCQPFPICQLPKCQLPKTAVHDCCAILLSRLTDKIPPVVTCLI